MRVNITDDFDPQKIIDSGQCFRCEKAGDRYVFFSGSHRISLLPVSGTIWDVDCSEQEWNDRWFSYFDLGRNYGEIRKSLQGDFLISQMVAEGCGLRILRQDPWEVLISFILSQRKSIPAIRSTIDALSKTCGEKRQTAGEEWYAFPTPEAILSVTDERLSQCGLGYRLPYVKDAAQKVCECQVSLTQWASLSDEDLRNALKTIKGVGDKVASCVMLFGYARLKSVPVDVWIRRLMTDHYEGENIFTRYGDYAGILQQYAFYYMLNHKADQKKGDR